MGAEALTALTEAIEDFEEKIVAHTAEVSMLRFEVAETSETLELQKALLVKKDLEIKQNRREFRWTILVLVVGFLVIIVNLGAYNVLANRAARKDRADIKHTLEIVQRAVDPNSDIGRRGAANQAEAVGLIILENDCRVRRALADLPAPPANTPCVLPE